MSQFLASLLPVLRSYLSKIANRREKDPDFHRRWMNGEIDEDGKAVPRNPQAVDEIKARIASTRRPAIIGAATEANTRSRLGGLPNLPQSMGWPTYEGRAMTLLAQIDLNEIPRCDDLAWLPKSGLLFYFAGRNDGDEWVEEASCVLFSEVASSERRSPLADALPAREVINLTFEVRDTYAPLGPEDDAGQWQDNKEIGAWYWSLMPFARQSPWQIGGWPNPLQSHDMQARAEERYSKDQGQESNGLNQATAGWELLGQFDLDRLFGQASGFSRGFFWVRGIEAAQRKFDRAVLIGQAD